VSVRLSLEDLAAIASARAGTTPMALALGLGRPRELVAWHVRRMRRAGGWYCPLKLTPCPECGLPVAGPPRAKAHPACVPAREARRARAKRAHRNATDPPEILAARRAREAAWAAGHYRGLPADRKAVLYARAAATLRRDYAITLEAADANRQRWTEDDDRYILANRETAARELALALGRTSNAVYQRRRKLLRRHALTAADGARTPAV
jgi:hypothetical protein